jgi:hypothetical protein
MPKSRLLDRLRRPPISYQEFMERHEEAKSVLQVLGPTELGPPRTLAQIYADLVNSSRVLPLPNPLPPIMEAIRDHPFFQLLRAAARENCPDAYNIFLYQWLSRMGVAPPEGVFNDPRRKSGRRRDRQTALIYEKWLALGRPTLGSRRLAFEIYGPLFNKANSAERKQMVDRCRRAVERTIKLMRPNSEQV